MNKLVLFVCAALLLASCSQRYGYIPKVRAQKHEVAATRPVKKKKLPELSTIPSKTAEQAVIAMPEAEIDRTVAANSKTENLPVMQKTGKVKSAIASVFHKNKTPLKETIQEYRAKKQNTDSQQKNEIQKGTWLWYVVVGLVLALIGALFPNPIGYIFYVVGLILIIYGLLVFLEVL